MSQRQDRHYIKQTRLCCRHCDWSKGKGRDGLLRCTRYWDKVNHLGYCDDFKECQRTGNEEKINAKV